MTKILEIKIRVGPAIGFIQVYIVWSSKAKKLCKNINTKIQIQVHTNTNTDQGQSLTLADLSGQHHIIAK